MKSSQNSETTNVINCLLLLANLGILGLTLKLYTELFKDKAFDQRSKGK